MRLLLKNVLFTVVVPGTVAGYAPWLLARETVARTGVLRVAGCALLGIGAAIYTWCVWDFATFGRGTPLPIDAPRRLVARGLYRVSRNPMYVGVLTVIAGWAVSFGSIGLVVYGVVVACFFHALVVLYEEPHLSRTFGSAYATYREEVGRWLSRPRRSSVGAGGSSDEGGPT